MKHRLFESCLIGLAASAIMLCVLGAAAPTSYPPSPFTTRTGTNTTAVAWRTALGAGSSSDISSVSNAQAVTDGKLAGYVTNLAGSLTNASIVGGSVTGQTNEDLTASTLIGSDADKKIVSLSTATYPSLSELAYVKGVTDAIQTQLNLKPTLAATNVGQLNQSQTWTGTPTFPAAVFSANGIGMRLLWSSPTNIYISSFVTNAASSLTNNGDYINSTPFVSFQIPPLLGSNSALAFTFQVTRTNANSSAAVQYLYIGPNTNFIGSTAALYGTTAGNTAVSIQPAIQLAASWTNQVQGFYATPVIFGPTNFFDATITNTVYIGGSTTTSHTNSLTVGFKCYEIYAP